MKILFLDNVAEDRKRYRMERSDAIRVPRAKRHRRRPIANGGWAALLCVAGIFAGCSTEDSDAASTKDEAPAVDPIPVEVMAVDQASFTDTVVIHGVSEPLEQRRIGAEAAGRVLAAPFEEGETIERGKLMVRVDADVTRANLNLLESQVRSAQREYNRVTQLAQEGLATPQQVDQAESALEQSTLGLKQGRVNLGKATVTAPIEGLVSEKFVDVGEFVSPGAPIADVVDLSTIKVRASVPQDVVSFTKKGGTVRVRFPALEKSFEGTITYRSVDAPPPARTFAIEVQIPNPEGAILPGMRAEVQVDKKTYDQVVVIPRDAVLEGFERREVVVVEGLDHGLSPEGEISKETTQKEAVINGELVGRADVRDVILGPGRGNSVVVTEGLKPGEALVTRGHRGLVDQTPVRVVQQRPSLKGATHESH